MYSKKNSKVRLDLILLTYEFAKLFTEQELLNNDKILIVKNNIKRLDER